MSAALTIDLYGMTYGDIQILARATKDKDPEEHVAYTREDVTGYALPEAIQVELDGTEFEPGKSGTATQTQEGADCPECEAQEASVIGQYRVAGTRTYYVCSNCGCDWSIYTRKAE